MKKCNFRPLYDICLMERYQDLKKEENMLEF